MLRHSFATELRTRRIPPRTIQDLLGHSTIAMTFRYAQVVDKSRREAVAELPPLNAERTRALRKEKGLLSARVPIVTNCGRDLTLGAGHVIIQQ